MAKMVGAELALGEFPDLYIESVSPKFFKGVLDSG